jgi:hypothetical protein
MYATEQMRDYSTPMEDNLTAQIAIQANLFQIEIIPSLSSRNIKIFMKGMSPPHIE